MKKFIAGFLSCALIMSTIGVYASTQKKIDALFGQVKLVVNGKNIDKETLLYDGRTYLPLRDVGDALNMEVGWDEKTSTASLTSKSAWVNPNEKLAGYKPFEDKNAMIKLQYPENWEIIKKGDSDQALKDTATRINDKMYKYDDLKELSTYVNAYWVDAKSDGKGFLPYASLNVLPSAIEGANVNDATVLKMLLETTKAEAKEESLDKVDGDIAIKRIGNIDYIVYKSNMELNDVISYNYYAITIYKGNTYTFKFITSQKIQDDQIAVYEKMLSTIIFGK